jgi:hypothetical protein
MSELIEKVKSRFDHEAARKVLKEKYQARMLFAHNGGMWQAGPALQTMLLTCPDSVAVILDVYENPVKIDVGELMSMSQQRWQEQMTAWLVEWDQLQKQR